MNHAPTEPVLKIRVSRSYALVICLSGIILLFIGLDFTFWGRFFLPEYGSEFGLFQTIFSLITLMGGGLCAVRGGWLLSGPLLLEIDQQALKLYPAWGTQVRYFSLQALDSIQVIRFLESGKHKEAQRSKEKWIVFCFRAGQEIPSQIPFRLGIQYERYHLKIATMIMQNNASQIASFLTDLLGKSPQYIDKE